MSPRNDHRILRMVCQSGALTWPAIRARLHRQYPLIHLREVEVIGLVAAGLLVLDQETRKYSTMPCPLCGNRDWSLDGQLTCLTCHHRPGTPPAGYFPSINPRFDQRRLPRCQACCGSAEHRGLLRFCRLEQLSLVSDDSLCLPRVQIAFPAVDPDGKANKPG